MNRLRITQTLLSNWLYSYKLDDGYDKFLRCLNRQKEPPTQAMLDGIHFEGLVNAALDGREIDPKNKLYAPVMECKEILLGAQQQVTLFRDIIVDGQVFTLHGVLDFLRAGEIFDTKFSKSYELNKYFNSPQTPMYFALVPEAYKFTYVICDGKYVYTEEYTPDIVKPIESYIRNFMKFLKLHNLQDTYAEKWQMQNYKYKEN